MIRNLFLVGLLVTFVFLSGCVENEPVSIDELEGDCAKINYQVLHLVKKDGHYYVMNLDKLSLEGYDLREVRKYRCREAEKEGENIHNIYCEPLGYYGVKFNQTVIDPEGNIEKFYVDLSTLVFDKKTGKIKEVVCSEE